MTRPVCPRNVEILVQDHVDLVLIVEWCPIIQFVVVHQDILEILWNPVGLLLLLSLWTLILVILILVDLTVKNMNKMDIVFVLVCQDTEELRQIANQNVLLAPIVD